MNKTSKTVALFSVLSLLAIGCQKENVTDYVSETTISEVGVVYRVQYTVDGVQHQITLHSPAERTDFFRQLLTMAKNGHEVVFYNGDKTEQCAATKDVVHYSTAEEGDALTWADKMYENGYKVRITYDEKKKVFNCIAWK